MKHDTAGILTVDIEAIVTDGRGLASTIRAGDTKEISKLRNVRLASGSLNLVGFDPIWLDKKAAFYRSEGTGHAFFDAYLNEAPVFLDI